MATFITNYLMYLVIGSALLGAFAFRAWGRSRGKTSVYASDTSLNDVALSLAGSLFDNSPDKVIGGAQTYRSTWGAKLLVLAVMLLVVFSFNIPAVIEGRSEAYNHMTTLVLTAAGLYVAFQWIMLAFVQRITVDGSTITSHGYALRPQSRQLDTLIDIQTHPEKRLLMLNFKGQPPIYAPRFLSQRANFVAEMEAHIRRNTRM